MSPSSQPADMHTVRNAAAAVLANVEHLSLMFEHETGDAPFFQNDSVDTRQDALRTLAAADRAVRNLVAALRALP